jgi:hypothetical protein
MTTPSLYRLCMLLIVLFGVLILGLILAGQLFAAGLIVLLESIALVVMLMSI